MTDMARNLVESAALAEASRFLAETGNCWLLVDHAIVGASRAAQLGRALGSVPVPALAGSPLAAFGEHGPHLWQVERGGIDQISNHLKRWVALEPTGSGLSWLFSSQLPQVLADLVAHLCLIVVDGDTRLHCRAADARVQRALLLVLTQEQLARVGAVVQAWGRFDELGQWSVWKSNGVASPVGTAAELQLDAHQYAQMLEHSEPDIVFGLLREKAPEVVPRQRLGEFRQRLSRFIATARPYRVTETLDLLQFCVLSLTLGERFHENPALGPTWQATRDRRASLKIEMESWSDELWDRLESTAAVN
jgi:Domain of unknown function (DUF4123)